MTSAHHVFITRVEYAWRLYVTYQGHVIADANFQSLDALLVALSGLAWVLT